MKSFGSKPWVLPQLVLVIGTYDKDHTPNAMNAAWAGQWDYEKIVISLGSHATTDNLRVNGDFTVAFATVDTMAAADYVGLVSGRKVRNKVARAGLESKQAGNVDAPVFSAFPMTLECRVSRMIDESETGCYLVGDIVNVLCDERYLTPDGMPDVTKLDLITYDPIHNGYIRLGERVGDAFAAGNAFNDK